MVSTYSKMMGFDLSRKGRGDRNISWARFCAYWDMQERGFTTREIAALFGRSQGGVSDGIVSFRNALSVCDKLAWEYLERLNASHASTDAEIRI